MDNGPGNVYVYHFLNKEVTQSKSSFPKDQNTSLHISYVDIAPASIFFNASMLFISIQEDSQWDTWSLLTDNVSPKIEMQSACSFIRLDKQCLI